MKTEKAKKSQYMINNLIVNFLSARSEDKKSNIFNVSRDREALNQEFYNCKNSLEWMRTKWNYFTCKL